MDKKAQVLQELATMEARRKQLEALLLQEQSPPPKSQTQLKGEQMMKEIYGITNAKVAESMVANILAMATAETQQHVEMLRCHLRRRVPPSYRNRCTLRHPQWLLFNNQWRHPAMPL